MAQNKAGVGVVPSACDHEHTSIPAYQHTSGQAHRSSAMGRPRVRSDTGLSTLSSTVQSEGACGVRGARAVSECLSGAAVAETFSAWLGCSGPGEAAWALRRDRAPCYT